MQFCLLGDMLKQISPGSLHLLFIYFSVSFILLGTFHLINAVGDTVSKLLLITGYGVARCCALFCSMDMTDGKAAVDLVCTPSVE